MNKLLLGVMIVSILGCDFLQFQEGSVEVVIPRVVLTNQPSFPYTVSGVWDAEIVLYQVDPKDPYKEVELERQVLAPGAGNLVFKKPLEFLHHRLKAVILSERSGSVLPLFESAKEYVFDISIDPLSVPVLGTASALPQMNGSYVTYFIARFQASGGAQNLRPGALINISYNSHSASAKLSKPGSDVWIASFDIRSWNLGNGSHSINYNFYNFGEDLSPLYTDQNLAGSFTLSVPP